MTSQGNSAGRRAVVAALVAAAWICLLGLAPSWAQAATGSIAGTVIDASTSEPIEGVRACTESLDESSYACSLTETDGTYSIGGLQPGQYVVWFWSESKYEFEFYDGASSWSEADPVEVLSGAKTAGIDAELQPTATIEGTVLATEDGLGVEEVEVCAYPLSAAEGNFWECGYTDGAGSYAIYGLEPGNYKVEFWPAWTGRELAYQFYDHRARYAEADVVALGAGEQRTGVDADLQPGAAIAGHVSMLATGLPLEEVRICAVDATTGKLTVCTWSDEDGDYRLRLLSAGPYKVVFSPEYWEFFPGEAFPGEDDDGLPTQFWNNQTTLAAANLISLGIGGSVGGVDARLGGAPAAMPPATVTPPTPPAPKRKRKCRRGYKRKLVHGKRRCVKVRKHHRRRHHSGGTRAQRLGPGAVRVLGR